MSKTFTADEIADLVNEAVNDIDDFADMADEGARDALNLLVNTVVTRARRPDETLSVEQVIEENYEAEVDEVRGWVEA